MTISKGTVNVHHVLHVGILPQNMNSSTQSQRLVQLPLPSLFR
jgi:hypothetical protein